MSSTYVVQLWKLALWIVERCLGRPLRWHLRRLSVRMARSCGSRYRWPWRVLRNVDPCWISKGQRNLSENISRYFAGCLMWCNEVKDFRFVECFVGYLWCLSWVLERFDSVDGLLTLKLFAGDENCELKRIFTFFLENFLETTEALVLLAGNFEITKF